MGTHTDGVEQTPPSTHKRPIQVCDQPLVTPPPAHVPVNCTCQEAVRNTSMWLNMPAPSMPISTMRQCTFFAYSVIRWSCTRHSRCHNSSKRNTSGMGDMSGDRVDRVEGRAPHNNMHHNKKKNKQAMNHRPEN